MKTFRCTFGVVTLLLSLLSLLTSAKWIHVKFKPTDVFIYEWRSNISNSPLNTIQTEGNRVIRFSLQIDSIAQNQIRFSARVLQNVKEVTQSSFENSSDYGYPELIKFYQEGKLNDILEETLYQIPFRFELDRKRNTVELANKDEIIKRSQEILKSRHYTNKVIENVKASLEYNVLYNKTLFFLAPFRYIRTNLDIQDTLTDNRTKILVQNHENGILEINGVPNENISYLNYKIDLQHGLIISSIKRKKLTDEEAQYFIRSNSSGKIEPEERLTLLEHKDSNPKRIIVCGHIDKPVSSQVNLFTQTKIFGAELDSKTVQLDKAGNFRFEFKLAERGLILLQNPNNNHFFNSVPILLYANPGDSIGVNFTLKNKEYLIPSLDPGNPNANVTDKYTVPETIRFSGDRSKEAQLLHQFQNIKGLPHIWAGMMSRVDCKVYLDALSELRLLLEPLAEDKSCSESFQYLQKELQAYLYSNLLNARIEYPNAFWTIISHGPIVSANEKDLIYNQLDTLNINRIYNDYGIFSRNLTQAYIGYKNYRLTNSNRTIINSFGPGWVQDPELKLQFCKMVLHGSPLYREAAWQLYANLISANPGSKTDNQWQSEINEMFGLMIERCNDLTFRNSLQEIVNNCNKWKAIKHVPDNLFLNLKSEKISLRSFIVKRPTIILAATSWSVGRYEMDDAAKQYPQFNFIHIDEGDNFDYWKKWNSDAKPVAHQLYLSSDTLRLRDIFLNNTGKFIIFDKSGKRIGIEREIETAISIAVEGKRQYFKDVSKSVLSKIIIVLGVLLVVLLAGFLFYKIRMNRRLRKQTQEKRLRELQMDAIRAQMNPHFLFNSLNSVQNLVQQNKNQEAHLYLSNFAGLIRKVLKNSDKEEVSLAEELETLEQYLNLEKLRFDFEYSIEVDDQIDQELFMLPVMILQPVVENAIVHGLQHKKGEKKLSICVTKSNKEIHIIINDNGIGIDASQGLKTNSNGIGLRMNEERIQMMKEKYGGNYSFKLINLATLGQEGTRVEITIPEE